MSNDQGRSFRLSFRLVLVQADPSHNWECNYARHYEQSHNNKWSGRSVYTLTAGRSTWLTAFVKRSAHFVQFGFPSTFTHPKRRPYRQAEFFITIIFSSSGNTSHCGVLSLSGTHFACETVTALLFPNLWQHFRVTPCVTSREESRRI